MSSQQPADSTATNDRKNLKRSSEQQDEMVEDVSRPPSKTMKQNPDGEDGSKPESSVTSDEVDVKTEAAPTDSERLEAEELSSLGLTVGARLEVMWLLEDDDSSIEKVSMMHQRLVGKYRCSTTTTVCEKNGLRFEIEKVRPCPRYVMITRTAPRVVAP